MNALSFWVFYLSHENYTELSSPTPTFKNCVWKRTNVVFLHSQQINAQSWQ